MKNSDIYRVLEGIRKISDIVNVADINFALGIARIESELVTEVKLFEKARKKRSEEFEKYLKDKETLDMKYAIQKEDGTFQMVGNSMLIKNPKKYHEEIDALRLKYDKDIKEQEVKDKEFETLMEQQYTKTITKLPKSLLPASLSVEQVSLLFPIIEV